MKFLKTFFGQVLRKTDKDFAQQSARDGAVLTHIDYSNSIGGVIADPVSGIQGLRAYVGANGLGSQSSIYVTPGIFYNKGSFSETNSLGGGERGQIFTQQIFRNLPYTYALGNGQPSYLVVYVKTIGVNYNPDPHQSQAIITSRDVITNENIPTREYTTGYIVISDPIALSQLGDLGGVPLALVQTDKLGNVTSFDDSVRTGYVIGGSVNLLLDQIIDIAVPDSFFTSDKIADDSVLDVNFSDSIAVSSDIAIWDGSSTDAFSGSGITTAHLKDESVTVSKLSLAGSMDGFSPINYLSNSSFENSIGSSSAGSLSGWSIYNPSNAASVTAVNTTQYFGSSSATLQGIILGQNPAVSQVVGLSQIVSFGSKINNQNIGAFFYLRTDNDIPMPILPNGVSGTTGLFGVVEFMSSGSTVGSPQVFASYTGSATDWTKLQSTQGISYSGSSSIDSVRFSISGSIGNVNAYVDGAFLGLTNLLPEWTPSSSDFALGDTLNIKNINVNQSLSGTSATIINAAANLYAVGTLVPATPHVTSIGSPTGTFSALSTNDIYVSGSPLRFSANCALYTSNGQFVVPGNVSSIIAELYGGGGGGSAGADEQGWSNWGWGGAGGNGGWSVKTSIDVTPGEVLNIIVGPGGFGGVRVEGSPFYNDYFNNGSNGGGRGGFGGDSKILDSSMNSIVVASGGMGGWGPWGQQIYAWFKNGTIYTNPSAPTTYTGSSFYVSGNTIYIQGTYGQPGWGPYSDYLNLGYSSVSQYGGNISGGDGGTLGVADIPSIPGGAGVFNPGFNAYNLFGNWWPQNYRPNGNAASAIGAGGGGGAGGYGTTSGGAGGYGAAGSPGLVRIYW